MAFDITNWSYNSIQIKNKIEHCLIFPLIVLGKCCFHLFGTKSSFDVYFFFPFYHTGGAERVHAAVARAVKNKKCVIFFTRKSVNDTQYNDFKSTGHTLNDVSKFTDNKWLYFVNIFMRGYYAAQINSNATKCVVFNGQCNFAYKIAPWVAVKQVELIHSFNSFSYIRVPYIKYYSKTVMISHVKIVTHEQYYKATNAPRLCYDNTIYIGNATSVPEQLAPKPNDKLRILYVGRNSPEKRLHIILEIAAQLQNAKSIEFVFMGITKGELPASANCTFLGNISDVDEINKIYHLCNVVMVTSDTEGMPLCIIEGMAMGCAVIATAVGDIPLHINNEVGLLVNELNDETKIKYEILNFISEISNDEDKLMLLQKNSFEYAEQSFGLTDFNYQYNMLLG